MARQFKTDPTHLPRSHMRPPGNSGGVAVRSGKQNAGGPPPRTSQNGALLCETQVQLEDHNSSCYLRTLALFRINTSIEMSLVTESSPMQNFAGKTEVFLPESLPAKDTAALTAYPKGKQQERLWQFCQYAFFLFSGDRSGGEPRPPGPVHLFPATSATTVPVPAEWACHPQR